MQCALKSRNCALGPAGIEHASEAGLSAAVSGRVGRVQGKRTTGGTNPCPARPAAFPPPDLGRPTTPAAPYQEMQVAPLTGGDVHIPR